MSVPAFLPPPPTYVPTRKAELSAELDLFEEIMTENQAPKPRKRLKQNTSVSQEMLSLLSKPAVQFDDILAKNDDAAENDSNCFSRPESPFYTPGLPNFYASTQVDSTTDRTEVGAPQTENVNVEATSSVDKPLAVNSAVDSNTSKRHLENRSDKHKKSSSR